MKVAIALLVVGAILLLAAYFRKRAFRDFIPQDQCSEKAENVIS